MPIIKAVSASEPRNSDDHVLVLFEVLSEDSDGSCSRTEFDTWIAPRIDGMFLALCKGPSHKCPHLLNLFYTRKRGAEFCSVCWINR